MENLEIESYKQIMRSKPYKIWDGVHIYDNAKLGHPVNIGRLTEIGDAVIGNYVRIGFSCFICGGVEIEDFVFIGPRVTFCHDKHFPSNGKGWENIIVKKYVRIGAGVTILAGVTIGEGSIIGAGSVITKDIPVGEIWVGNPARSIK
jgi:UDP-2-acetamido-3-amino-2,3-dideoxy-glucuronate N-acetyltransferase